MEDPSHVPPLGEEATELLRRVVTSRRRMIRSAYRRGRVDRSFFEAVNVTLDHVLGFVDDEDSLRSRWEPES